MQFLHALLAFGLNQAVPTTHSATEQSVADCLSENGRDLPGPRIIDSCTDLLRSEALSIDDRLVALANRAVGYRKLEDFDRAIADYDEALRLDPDFSWALNGRGATHVERGEYDQALIDLAAGVRVLRAEIALADPGTEEHDALVLRLARAYYVRGVVHARREDHRRAAEDLREGFRLASYDPDIGNGLCWSLAVSGGDLEEARAACDAALRARPNYGPTLDSRAMVGLKQGRFQDAWNDYDAAVRTGQAALPTFLYGRGIAALRLGRIAEGRADIERATALNRELPQFYARYGIEP
jgi:tetratricopeptide (TPR) repeat protein